MDAMRADLAELDEIQSMTGVSMEVAVKPSPSSTAVNSIVNDIDLSTRLRGSPRNQAVPLRQEKLGNGLSHSKSEPAIRKPSESSRNSSGLRMRAGTIFSMYNMTFVTVKNVLYQFRRWCDSAAI